MPITNSVLSNAFWIFSIKVYVAVLVDLFSVAILSLRYHVALI
jgi:hypothetical protein